MCMICRKIGALMENFVAIRLKICNAMHKKYTWLHGGNLKGKNTSITSFLNPDEDFDRKKKKTFS